MVAPWRRGWPIVGYSRSAIGRLTLQLLHETNPLVVCVSFSAALCVVVLPAFAHLPLHAEQGRIMGVIRQTCPFRVRLLKTRQVAHACRRATITARYPAVRGRLEI